MRIAILVIALVFICSCNDRSGITQMQAAIDNGEYAQMVALCEDFKGNPKRNISLELGLEKLKTAYSEERVAKNYFIEILSREESDQVLVKYGAATIIEHCDTIAFLNLVNNQSLTPGSQYLQHAFDIAYAPTCPRMLRFLSDLYLTQMQDAIDNHEYAQMVALCEDYEGIPKRNVALKLGIEKLKIAYGEELVAKNYFIEILSREESDPVLVQLGASAIMENCDTLAFLELVKTQSSILGSQYLQNAFDIDSGAICPIMQRYLHDLKLINYAIDDSIGLYQSDVHKIDEIISQKQSEFQTTIDRINEISDMSWKEYYFYVISSEGNNTYEVAKAKKGISQSLSYNYDNIKGTQEVQTSAFEIRHSILVTSSLDIGKGLYRFNAYKNGTQIVKNVDGFNQEWDIYRGVEPDKLDKEKKNLEKKKRKLRAEYKRLQKNRDIHSWRMSIFMATKKSYSNILN